ncbi:5'-methylthioadenosine/adenosylhomocysteine nucleosidase [Flavobacteriaceae bacterium]|nr:5'-methylthioadenosine/adenosylhomocysteine nucleosidase [Flavobacteriaceae bacterium]
MGKLSIRPIGIMSAMLEEISSIIEKMKIEYTEEIGGRQFHIGTLFNKPVVLVFSHWGKVASAMTTLELINRYQVERLIFTGVAGSIDQQVNIGDLVQATELIQHDMDASPLYPKFVIPLINKKSFVTFKDSEWDKALMETSNELDIKVHRGLILSGDQFISKPTQIAPLKKLLPEALAIEMEGAAVAQVCFEYKIPFNILRIISDKADDNAKIDFPKFAKQVASKVSLIFFRNLLNA